MSPQEDQHTEWKESWRDEHLKWICAFANADGGTLHIGRNDQGKVVGLKNAKKLLEDIPNQARDILGVMVDVNLRDEGGQGYLEVVVEAYTTPISYRGEYHYRSGSTKQQLKGAALDRFLLRKQGRTWDGVPVPGVTIDQLSPAAVKSFLKRAVASGRLDDAAANEPLPALLDKLRLREDGRLKRAATLLFAGDDLPGVTGAYLKIGFFRTNADLVYHDVIEGDLFAQVDRGLDLILTKYLRAAIRYEGVQRVERYPVPRAALREALLNAVIHKDYATGVPIQISVYDDRLMIWNPGVLPEGWTVQRLLEKHPSIPFNPVIAHTFFRSGMIEAWGRGIERIFDATDAADTPRPSLRYDHGGLWTEFMFSEAMATTKATPPKTSVETSVETSGEKPRKTPEALLWLLRAEPTLTLAAAATRLGKSTRAVEMAAAKLRSEERLRHVGPTKSGRWEVLAPPPDSAS